MPYTLSADRKTVHREFYEDEFSEMLQELVSLKLIDKKAIVDPDFRKLSLEMPVSPELLFKVIEHLESGGGSAKRKGKSGVKRTSVDYSAMSAETLIGHLKRPIVPKSAIRAANAKELHKDSGLVKKHSEVDWKAVANPPKEMRGAKR